MAKCGGFIPDPALNMGSHYDVEPGGGVYVPFKDLLFGGAGAANQHVAARVRGTIICLFYYQSEYLFVLIYLCYGVASRNANGMRTVEAAPSVLHSGNRGAAAQRVPSRILVAEADGSSPQQENTGCLNQPYPGRDARRDAARALAAAKKNTVLIIIIVVVARYIVVVIAHIVKYVIDCGCPYTERSYWCGSNRAFDFERHSK